MTVYRYKTTCAAFGCTRFTRRIDSPRGVYLCPTHWPTVPKRLRRLMNKAFRRQDERGNLKDQARVHRLWAKCVDAANREQFGI